jgi:RimJ/RimL family protein N-acetyltransferase
MVRGMPERVRIVTERLELREYAADDLAALAAYQADPRSREFYGPDATAPERVPRLLETFLAWADEEPRSNWQLAVSLRDAPRSLVGSCGLRRGDLPAGTAEFGLELAPDTWGRGYAIEAATALLDHGFRRLGLVSVRGFTVSGNARVTTMARRLGLRCVTLHPGPAWMKERGWCQIEWEIDRDGWAARHR